MNKVDQQDFSQKSCQTERWATRRAAFDTREAARYLGVSYSTLTKWRVVGYGPKFYRAGQRRVVYRPEDLDAWLDGRMCLSTSSEIGTGSW